MIGRKAFLEYVGGTKDDSCCAAISIVVMGEDYGENSGSDSLL